MEFPAEYMTFLLVFHTSRDYFVCHDLLEELWREDSLTLDKSHVYVGLLQFAVAMYHWRRNNMRGAQLLMTGSYDKLILRQSELEELGINSERLLGLIATAQRDIFSGCAYASVMIPLRPSLQMECMKQCEKQGLLFGQASDMKDEYIIHRHLYK